MMPPIEKAERIRRAIHNAEYDSIVEVLRDIRHLLDQPDTEGDYDTLDAYAEQEYLIDTGKQKEFIIWQPQEKPKTNIKSKPTTVMAADGKPFVRNRRGKRRRKQSNHTEKTNPLHPTESVNAESRSTD